MDIFHKLLLLRMPGVGPVKFATMIQKYGSAEAAVAAQGFDDDYIDSVRVEMDAAARQHIIYISDDDESYPENLRAAKNHPPVISVLGNADTMRRRMVGMVGTRHATAAGMRFMADLAREFVEHNYCVVSGMAMGTDSAAARGALSAMGANNTIAVLAGGVDYIWPLENEKLYREIIERGCIVSEMPVGAIPRATNFVQRNRIIAGLSELMVLGEADEKSGSMTTAAFMTELLRPLWAIPSHPSDSRSVGPNRLIRDNIAKLCMGADDFFIKSDKKPDTKDKMSDTQNDLMDLIGFIPISESVLSELAKKSISDVKRQLVKLEIGGYIKKTDGGYVKN